MTMKGLLLDILRLLERKLVNDECTREEVAGYYKLVSDNMDVLVSVKDLSEMYKKPVASVKVCMSRNRLAEKNPPKVRKFYSFMGFRKIMPKTWQTT